MFAVKPVIVDAAGEFIVANGRRLTLLCRVRAGSPSPMVTWYINGSLATDSPRSPLIDRVARMLIIRSTTDKDSGRYTCVATNTAGSDVMHFDVHVIGLCHVSYARK